MNLKYTRLSLGMLFLVVFSLAGCGFQPLRYFGLVEPARDEALRMQLKEGNRLFKEGKYTEAEKVFQSLQHSENLHAAHQAVYGLACTRLRLAENRTDYLDAVKLMDQWRRLSPVWFGAEDPRMLLLVFSEALSRGPESSQDTSEEPLLIRFYDYEKEIGYLRRRIGGMEKKIQEVKGQEAAMESMEKELITLRNQIKTIETIDQKIQEKKQGISSP